MIKEDAERWQIEFLLPWYAAGTLSRSESDCVEKALADDPELARRYALVLNEMAEAARLNEALGEPSASVAKKLFAAIDAEEASEPNRAGRTEKPPAGRGCGCGRAALQLSGFRHAEFSNIEPPLGVEPSVTYVPTHAISTRNGLQCPALTHQTPQRSLSMLRRCVSSASLSRLPSKPDERHRSRQLGNGLC
jgi:hypothetical protein